MIIACAALDALNSGDNEMTNNQFNLNEMAWAKKLLSEPPYVMQNGRKSHDVAHEVMSKALDRMLDENRINAHGQFR